MTSIWCASAAGPPANAAVQPAKLGERAAVIEKHHCVGGVCIDTGTIPSKILREAVVTFLEARQ